MSVNTDLSYYVKLLCYLLDEILAAIKHD